MLFITQTARFSGDSFAAKEYASQGMLGDMYYAETATIRRRGIPKWGVFHIKEFNAGGPVYDIGVHALDMLIWVMGNPKVTAVSGQTVLKFGNKDEDLATSLFDSGADAGLLFEPRPYDYREFDVEDFASGYMRLENGGSLVLRTSWAANVEQGAGSTFILGTGGGLMFNPLRYIANQGRYMTDSTPQVPTMRGKAFSGHFRYMKHAVSVLRGEEEKIVKREEVLNVIRALDALYESAEVGHEVRID